MDGWKGKGNLRGGSNNRLNRLDRSTRVGQCGRLALLCRSSSQFFALSIDLHVPYVVDVIPCGWVRCGGVLGSIQLLLSDLKLLLQAAGLRQHASASLG